MSKNDCAWERFFDATGALSVIRETGYVRASADELKRSGGREPRLMAKLDTLELRPKVFIDNDLSILPVRNGEYIIFSDPETRSYFDLSTGVAGLEIEQYDSLVPLDTFDSYPGPEGLSESQALDFALISSMLKTYTGDDDLRLTIRGRLYSAHFSFTLLDIAHRVDVAGVQIEVDAGYETDTAIYLVEAKVGKRSNFHIRQLYYPYLDWSIRSRKRIVPILFIYSNGLYWLRTFRFGRHFGELEMAKARCYSLNESPRVLVDVAQVLRDTPEGNEPDVPYPQADDMDKVLDTVRLVWQGMNNKAQLAEAFEFDERQGDYYGNAARYLGLLDREDNTFVLTRVGEQFLAQDSRGGGTRLILTQLASRPTFRTFLDWLVRSNYDLDTIDRGRIVEVIERHTPLTSTTLGRRASTVWSWLKWILQNCDVAS